MVQLVENRRNLDVLLNGGRRRFSPLYGVSRRLLLAACLPPPAVDHAHGKIEALRRS
jgi:hypothetical protein